MVGALALGRSGGLHAEGKHAKDHAPPTGPATRFYYTIPPWEPSLLIGWLFVLLAALVFASSLAVSARPRLVDTDFLATVWLQPDDCSGGGDQGSGRFCPRCSRTRRGASSSSGPSSG